MKSPHPFSFLTGAPRNLFFTGKGGVGKTSLARASALALADAGKRVLLVSTDPASNLQHVFETEIGEHVPTAIPGTDNLFALNINPESAAQVYRDRVVGPVRGLLPEATVREMEEQLSGACTTEIAVFQAFSKAIRDWRRRPCRRICAAPVSNPGPGLSMHRWRRPGQAILCCWPVPAPKCGRSGRCNLNWQHEPRWSPGWQKNRPARKILLRCSR